MTERSQKRDGLLAETALGLMPIQGLLLPERANRWLYAKQTKDCIFVTNIIARNRSYRYVVTFAVFNRALFLKDMACAYTIRN